MEKIQKLVSKNKVLVFVILAIISLILGFMMIGIVTGFWIILISWIIVFLLFFVRPAITAINIYMIAITIVFVLSILISFRVIFSDGSTSGERSADGVLLSDCTSTTSEQPQMLDGWKSTIYSAPFSKTTSPNPDEANNVRSFSYSGIKDKTEKNSMYVRIEKADESYIAGYGTTIEVCSADNKTTWSYAAANTKYLVGERAIASVSYFHGGAYLHGAGDYRIDAYVKTLDGKWHLVDRMTGIKITE